MRRFSFIAWVILLSICAGNARAATRTFAANSIIIPMDMCYQSSLDCGSAGAYCASPSCDLEPCVKTGNKCKVVKDKKGNTVGDDGIFKAYGLVYMLQSNGINVYLAIDPAKPAIDAPDFSVTAPSGSPVSLYDRTVPGNKEFFASGSTITYRGAPFIIDAADTNRVLSLIQSDPNFTPTFDSVVLHIAKQSFQAPVALTLYGTPPRLAVLNVAGAATDVMPAYLNDAGLGGPGAAGTYGGARGTVYDLFSNDSDFTSGGLTSGGYQILWAPHWTGDSQLNGVTAAIASFVDAGNAYFAECASLEAMETSYAAGNGTVDTAGATSGRFQTTLGIWKNALTSWGSAAGQAWRYADLANMYVQTGDFKLVNVSGHVQNWQAQTGVGSVYRPGLSRLITSFKAGDAANSDWDIETFIRKDNSPGKGPIIYLGGHSYSGQVAGERLVLNTLLFLGQQYITTEVTRSSPIVLPDGTTYQGSYLNASVALNGYPPVTGHFRQLAPGALSGSHVARFDSLNAAWDAANGIPPAAGRTINTVVTVSGKLQQIPFTTANVTPIAAAMGLSTSAATTAINGIRAGGLGGIDHSIPAIIGPSTVAGSAARPTVAYVGGLDGMLHCIGISGTGVTAGQEVWAFIPNSQLPGIATYQAGVDGSPQVADAFVDVLGTGQKSWRTLLATTNGAFGGTVSVIDVTDPLNPTWLWTGANTSGGYAMGAANGAAFGSIQGINGVESVVYVATRNAGAAGNGFNLYALDAATGTVIWQWNHLYSRKIPGTATLVPNDVPPIPTSINMAGDGGLDTQVFLGDLDGRIWAIGAASGAAPAGPLYDAGADGYPINSGIGVYRDKVTDHLAVVAATGGKDWIPASFTEYAIGINAQAGGAQLWKTSFAAGERVYAAPTISGNDVYFISSFGSFAGNIGATVNDAGNLYRMNLTTGATTLLSAVKKGESEVALDAAGNVTGASAGGETRSGNTGRDTTNPAFAINARPFTVGAWLDLR